MPFLIFLSVEGENKEPPFQETSPWSRNDLLGKNRCGRP
jgi:hypothetical protein